MQILLLTEVSLVIIVWLRQKKKMHIVRIEPRAAQDDYIHFCDVYKQYNWWLCSLISRNPRHLGEKGRRGDRFRMGYDRAQECRRSTEVNGRGFWNTDMDHYTTARFKGMKEGKRDGRGLPEVKAGSRMYKSGRPGKVFDKSGRWTEDGSEVRRPEYSDVGGSVKTTENDGKPNNVNNQSKTFYSNSGDRNIKPEEDGDEQMITGSHPVVVRMSSGVELEHQDDRKVSPEVTKGVRWKRPENPDVKEDRRLRPDEPDAEARSHVRRRKCRRAKSREKPERKRGPENGSLNSRLEEERQQKSLKAEVDLLQQRREFEPEDLRHPESGGLSRRCLTYAGVRVGDPANTEGMNEGGREPEVQRKSRKKAKLKVTIADERTSPITRPEVVGEIGAELFPGNAETKAEGGDTTTCVFATRSISANRKIRGKRWESRRRTEISPTSSNANLGNGNGRKGEGKPDGMPEQLPEEGTEGTKDSGKDRRKLREMAEVQGYAENVKSEKDRPGGESEVDFTRRKFAGTMSVISRNEPENSGEFDRNPDDIMADKPEEPIMPEVVSANPPEESRGGSGLVKGPEEDELAELRKTGVEVQKWMEVKGNRIKNGVNKQPDERKAQGRCIGVVRFGSDQGRDKPDKPDKLDEPAIRMVRKLKPVKSWTLSCKPVLRRRPVGISGSKPEDCRGSMDEGARRPGSGRIMVGRRIIGNPEEGRRVVDNKSGWPEWKDKRLEVNGGGRMTREFPQDVRPIRLGAQDVGQVAGRSTREGWLVPFR
ncbi:hypothetical protein K438DRAFT_1949685 [Mycena galopus ATCC 62051]|nr:hypothetical protein K438DRAFT_1949685 [Mycena galopus ATCC 62051]